MPCDMLQIQSIDFTSAKNHEDVLADALRALGYSVQVYGKQIQFQGNGVSGSYSNGQFRATDGFDADAVKREFGKKAVQKAAKRFGWDLVTAKDGKMKLRKRI